MKFITQHEEQRPHLKLYHDQNINILNVDHVLSQTDDKKELQDVVQSLHSNETITHFSHHSDRRSMEDAFNAEQRIKQLQTQLDPQYLNKQNPQQQQATRVSVHQQIIPLQEKLSLLQQVQQIVKQGLGENQYLVHLDLSNSFMRDELAVELANIFVINDNLAFLNLANNALTEKGGLAVTSALSQNKTLQYLNLSHNNLTPKVLENLAATLDVNSSLTDLNLSNNHQGGQVIASEAILAIVTSNALITTIDLNSMALGSEGFSKILPAIGKHQALVNVNIATNGLDLLAVELLAQVLSQEECKLLHLNISNNPLTLDGLALLASSLQSNNSLETLEISRIGDLGKVGGQHLSLFITDNTSLMALDVSNNNLTYIGAKFLAKGLNANTALQQINIANNHLDEAGCIFVSKALEANNKLATLDLKDNHVQSTGAIYLAGLLEQYNYIKYLNLSGNQIDDTGIEALASVMQNLKILDIGHNQITANGAKFLAESLQSGNSLNVLILNNNNLQVTGTLEIISALQDSFSLHTLGLGSVNIGDAGIEQIVPALLENMGIAKLDLSSNSIAKNGTVHIANLLKENSCISKLNLSGNQLTAESEALIAEVTTNSNVINLGNLTDASGELRKALTININRLQSKLQAAETEQASELTPQELYVLYHQVLARKESAAPELSYTDIKDDAFYFTKISDLLNKIKLNLDSELSILESSNEDVFYSALESIDLIGHVDIPTDLI